MLQKFLGSGTLGKRVGNAGFWAVIGFGGNSGMRLFSNLALTRFLSPEIFGLMALAQVITNGIAMLSDVGVTASVIRSERGKDEEFLQTAWSVQVARAAIIATICVLLAWPISVLYKQPILFPIVCALAMAALVRGFQSISVASASRELIIKPLTLLTLGSQFAAVLITIFLAWQFQSVWALVAGAISGGLIIMILTHIVLPKFNHRFRFERQALGEIVGFGKWIILATLFTFISGRGQQGIFGLLLPLEVIGLISIATLLASVPNEFFKAFLNTILLPSFSEILRERPEQLPRILRKVRIATICMSFPMLFIVAYFAQDIIDLLYDERYSGAGIMLALMALNFAIPTLSTTYQNLMLAEGRSDQYAALMFGAAVSTVLGITLGFMVSGLVGSLIGVGLAMCLMFFTNVTIAVRRGYATIWLDTVAFLIIVAVYTAFLMSLDIPQAYLSPDLVSEIIRQ